jgi:hypothetical protein
VQRLKDKRVALDTLVTYQVGPGTAIYIGYTTGFQNVMPSIDGWTALRIATPPTQVSQQLFVKVGCLFRR